MQRRNTTTDQKIEVEGLTLGNTRERFPPPFTTGEVNDRNYQITKQLRWERLKTVRKLLPGERVSKCNWLPVSSLITIWKNREAAATHFRNIFTCGSVWHCPVCAAKITHQRRKDLQQAINRAKVKGWGYYFVTYTIGHKYYNTSKAVLKKLQEATRKLRAGKPWMKFKAKYGYQGSIIPLEVTFSQENGTHAHKHEIMFTDHKLNDDEIENLTANLEIRYMEMVAKVGGYATKENGIKVLPGNDDNARYVADYIAKFGYDPKVTKVEGLVWEATNWHTKGKAEQLNHFTAFQLLDLAAEGDQWAEDMFLEYAATFKGRKQLTWTPGLRDKLEVVEKELSDQESAEISDQEASIYAAMVYEEFKKFRHEPFEVLEAARMVDLESFKIFMFRRFGAVVGSVDEIIYGPRSPGLFCGPESD